MFRPAINKAALKRIRAAALRASQRGAVRTSLTALLCSSLFMSVTGGGLKPYEARAIQAAFASLIGQEAAAHALSADIDAMPVRTKVVHLIPAHLPGPPVDVDMALLGGDLLGGPLAGEAPRLPDLPRVIAVADATPRPLDDACMQDACVVPTATADDAQLLVAAAVTALQ